MSINIETPKFKYPYFTRPGTLHLLWPCHMRCICTSSARAPATTGEATEVPLISYENDKLSRCARITHIWHERLQKQDICFRLQLTWPTCFEMTEHEAGDMSPEMTDLVILTFCALRIVPCIHSRCVYCLADSPRTPVAKHEHRRLQPPLATAPPSARQHPISC